MQRGLGSPYPPRLGIFMETEKSGPHPKPPELEALQVTPHFVHLKHSSDDCGVQSTLKTTE